MNGAAAPLPTAPTAPALWLLVLVTLSGTMAMHMFVPALPDAARSLGSGPGPMQMALSIYIVGLGVGQLFYGPLSDAYGRRPLVMAGLVLYVLGGVLAAAAPNVTVLLVARLLQALGGCAGLALGRAIVRDTASPGEGVRQLALLNLLLMASPGLSPVIGGAVSGVLGWRAVFVLLAAIGAATFWFAWRRLPETARPSGRIGMASVRRDYRALLGSRRFLGFALGGSCCTTAIFAFVSAAPFIYTTELHQPPAMVGLYMGLLALGMGGGNLLTSRLIRRVPIDGLMRTGNAISVASATVLLGVILAGQLSVATTLVLMLAFTCGAGMTSPAALGKVIDVDRHLIGSAAGLYGFIQMTVGALCTTLAAAGPDPALAAVGVLLAASLCAMASFALAHRAERRQRSVAR